MQVVSSSFVRDWAVNAGLRSEDAKVIGRLSNAEVEEFNRRHRTKQYTPGVKPPRTLAVKVGRKTVTVESAVLRKGIKAGKVGRIDQSKAAAFLVKKGLA